MELPKEIEKFVNSLSPDDVGVQTVGNYVVHFEGFTDQCNDGHDDESIDQEYAEVYQDFDDRQGQQALVRGVAYDDLGVECNPVLYSVYGKLKETRLDFELIDKEISEARLYRQSRSFGDMTGRNIADLLYLSFLSLIVFAKDEYKSEYAKAYARQTSQYGSFTMFRSHATDIYLLAYQVKNPDNRYINLKNKSESTRFLQTLPFDNRKFYFMVSNIARGKLNKSELRSYLYRLEMQLKISNSNFKQYRRLIVDWENLKFAQRQYVTAKVLQDFRRYGRGSEMVSSLNDMAKYKKFRLSPSVKSSEYKEPKPSVTRRVAGTAAGALAGRFAGKKIAQKFGKDVDKYKKYGTGLGAIAGYWASGRQRQK